MNQSQIDRLRRQCLDVSGAVMEGASLSRANLAGAVFHGANLRGSDLQGADLRKASLISANLKCADLGGANLGRADLRNACLEGANLCRVNLNQSNLLGARLEEAQLDHVDLAGAILPDGTHFSEGENLQRFTDRAHPAFLPTLAAIRAIDSPELSAQNKQDASGGSERPPWKQFIEQTYGSLADDPIDWHPSMQLDDEDAPG